MAEAGGSEEVGAALGSQKASVNLDCCHVSDRQIVPKGAKPGKGGAGAVLLTEDGAVCGYEPHLHPWTIAVGKPQEV